jgi:uncharacterized membrane protein
MLPMILIIMLLVKAHEILSRLIEPISRMLPDSFLGFDGSRVLSLFLMVMICFISGLLFRSQSVRKRIAQIEDNFLYLIPGYTLIKSITADAVGDKEVNELRPVLVETEGLMKIGFLAEEKDDLCVVFFPEPTKSDAGEVVIMPSSSVTRIDASTAKIAQCMKRFGKGILQYSK